MKYSVIMPAHRTGPLLLAAVRSVEHAMGNDHGELIVVANGKDRRAVRESLETAGIAPVTRIVECEIANLIYALNRGIEVAQGEFVARMDSDDLCLQDRFRHQYEIAQRTEADFLFSAAEVIDANGNRVDNTVLRPHLDLWRHCGPIHPAAFIRRKALLALGGYGNIEYCEDSHLWLRASLAGKKLVLDDKSVIMYRVHQGQITDRSAVVNIFATSAGVKLILALRHNRPMLFVGSCLDFLRVLYRRCADKFS